MAGFSSKRSKIRQPDSEFPLLKLYYQELFPVSKLSVSARDTCVGLKVSEVNLLSQIDQIKESQAIGIGTVSPCVLPPPLHNPTTCISFMK
ncbi:uncharacterized protein LOC112036631 isoform X2 [Quercus suber]|uniref:uncharacterized protein LOC112036631 isoform X2 n=1 Tax=Quercus suber TaxID=58331 RepID=UPI0032DF474D